MRAQAPQWLALVISLVDRQLGAAAEGQLGRHKAVVLPARA
jgi:hypothetical protein